MHDLLEPNDYMRYEMAISLIRWENVQFKSYKAVDCKRKWNELMKNVRLFRTLSDLIIDMEKSISCSLYAEKKNPEANSESQQVSENKKIHSPCSNTENVGRVTKDIEIKRKLRLEQIIKLHASKRPKNNIKLEASSETELCDSDSDVELRRLQKVRKQISLYLNEGAETYILNNRAAIRLEDHVGPSTNFLSGW